MKVLLALAIAFAPITSCNPPVDITPPEPEYPFVETEDRLCPDGHVARDYEGQEFIVGVDRVRPDWGTYEPWTCLGISG